MGTDTLIINGGNFVKVIFCILSEERSTLKGKKLLQRDADLLSDKAAVQENKQKVTQIAALEKNGEELI